MLLVAEQSETHVPLPVPPGESGQSLAELLSLTKCNQPTNPVFLDIETTGLNAGVGTLVFLVGVASVIDGDCIVRQFFLEDPAREPELLTNVAAALGPFTSLITFNGKRFDAPLLSGRYILHRFTDPIPVQHVDLLPPARRIWGRRLHQTSLLALEARVLGITRDADVPGSEAPARYFEFLRAGNYAAVAPILDHNRHDLVAMVRLAGRINALLAEPSSAFGAGSSDLLGLGALLEALGRRAAAQECYEAALVGSSSVDRAEALFRLASLADKNEAIDRIVELLEAVASFAVDRAIPASIELAKIFEHRTREPERALPYAHRALALLRARPTASPGITLPDVTHRIARLERKIQARAR